jgi:drug/metabolite transporter (DMT)-like permease
MDGLCKKLLNEIAWVQLLAKVIVIDADTEYTLGHCDNPQPAAAMHLWLVYALLTVLFWGLYGVFLHNGQVAMADPVNGRYKAFLLVGIAYFLTAVLAPLAILIFKGSSWSMPGKGVTFSLVAGLVGAAGAFCVLLAFGAKGTPPVVMSIIFAGAPIINAGVAIALHPPAGGWQSISLPFYLGIVLAAVGGCLVSFYKPAPSKPPPKPDVVQTDVQ